MRRSGAAAVCKNDRALQRRKETKGIYHEETLLDHSLHCLNSEATMIMCLSESIESKEKRTPALHTHTAAVSHLNNRNGFVSEALTICSIMDLSLSLQQKELKNHFSSAHLSQLFCANNIYYHSVGIHSCHASSFLQVPAIRTAIFLFHEIKKKGTSYSVCQLN